jgi:hypothetical protein
MVKVTGGDKLAQVLGDFAKKMSSAKTVRIGFLEGARYPDGTSVALVAALNEYGVPKHGQPPRPFFRNLIAAKKGEWPGAIAQLLRDNGYDAKLTLQLTGEAIAGQLRQSIVDLVSPPLAPSTIARKGFDKPLIDSGHMLQSVSYEVKA